MTGLDATLAQLRENDGQWRAFSTDGHCAVLAPPGSGKTKLLTAKVASDLSRGVVPPARGAACITMTNEAAGELRFRLSRLGIRPGVRLFVGTVHAFAMSQIVLPYRALALDEDERSLALAGTDDQNAAFERAYASLQDENFPTYGARPTMDRIRRLADYSGDHLLGGPPIVRLARAYEADLRGRGLFDFNDLVRQANGMVADNAWLRNVLVATFPRLYVDEYQDLPPALDTLVGSLCFGGQPAATLFAVGDPDQAIYGFMGTKPELLAQVAERPDVVDVTLRTNYRCGQDLVAVSHRALGEPRDVTGSRLGGHLIIEPAAGSPEQQYAAAADLAKAAIQQGTSADEIGVLVHSKEDRERQLAVLIERDVPSCARSDKWYSATPLTLAIEATARYVSSAPRPVTRIGELMDAWEQATNARLDVTQSRAFVAVTERLDADSLATELLNALRPLGLQAVHDQQSPTEDRRQLERLEAALANPTGLAGATASDLGRGSRIDGHVYVTTLHGAKGLEFDIAIVTDFEEGRIPHWSVINDGGPAEMAEAKRLLYVAITRARFRVHLLWANSRISRAGNPYPIRVSRFAHDLTAD